MWNLATTCFCLHWVCLVVGGFSSYCFSFLGIHRVTIQDATGHNHVVNRYYGMWNKPRPESATIVCPRRQLTLKCICVIVWWLCMIQIKRCIILTHWLCISGWGICFQASGWFHKGEILSPTGYNRWIWMGFQYTVDEVICFVIYCLAELSLVTLFICWVTWAHNGYMKFAILNLHLLFLQKIHGCSYLP